MIALWNKIRQLFPDKMRKDIVSLKDEIETLKENIAQNDKLLNDALDLIGSYDLAFKSTDKEIKKLMKTFKKYILITTRTFAELTQDPSVSDHQTFGTNIPK